MTQKKVRDHGGGLDLAIARFGGQRSDWIDLSTGINPTPYPIPDIPHRFWQGLPDQGAQQALHDAALKFWAVPQGAEIVSASGVSALIAALPRLAPPDVVGITPPTYNEHAASFRNYNWSVSETRGRANVYVHPNNPDGRVWSYEDITTAHDTLTIIDESFCDISPQVSLINLAERPGYVVLKGLGKFWGLAGLRLGFAMAHPDTITTLADMIGPWAISGPAQHIGQIALSDQDWADATRKTLDQKAKRLDQIFQHINAKNPRGTSLFRLYDVPNAAHLYEKLAKCHILTRIFPYSDSMIRIGLPGDAPQWQRLEKVLVQ